MMNNQSREQQLSNIRGTKDLWMLSLAVEPPIWVLPLTSSRGLKTLLIERFDFTKGITEVQSYINGVRS